RRLHELDRVGDGLARQGGLLVGLLVHEDDLVAGLVEVLHVLDLGVDARELLARAEGAVDDRARVEVLHARPHERAALAGLDVLELHDSPDAAVQLDVHAVAELVGADDLRHQLTVMSSFAKLETTSGSPLVMMTRSSIRIPPVPSR